MRDGRQIAITGVSRGIGLALAEEFIRLGHTVSGCARTADAINGLNARYGAPHEFHVVDVRSDEAVSGWASLVLTEHGPPDLLLNNAGASIDPGLLHEVSDSQFAELLETDVQGTYRVLRRFLPAMMERGAGVIVNLGGPWGRMPSPRMTAPCAAKWAIEGLTRALADELPYGLAAIPLDPGLVCTESLERCIGERARDYPTPEQWARRAAPFLLELGPEDSGDSLTAPT